jgi:hypothetical protein
MKPRQVIETETRVSSVMSRGMVWETVVVWRVENSWAE